MKRKEATNGGGVRNFVASLKPFKGLFKSLPSAAGWRCSYRTTKYIKVLPKRLIPSSNGVRVAYIIARVIST